MHYQKHKNLIILGTKHYSFLKLKKNIYNIHYISKYIKVYNMAKNSFLVGINFQDKISSVLNSHLVYNFQCSVYNEIYYDKTFNVTFFMIINLQSKSL